MRYVSNLTDKNVKALEALPAGFQIEYKVLGPYNPYKTYETATVLGFENDGDGYQLRLFSIYQPTGEGYTWRLYSSTCHTGQEHLSYGSGAELVSVRWCPKAAEIYRQLSDGTAFAHAVLTVLAPQ